MKRAVLWFVLKLFVVAVGFSVFLNTWGWFIKPSLEQDTVPRYTAEELDEVKKLREVKLDPDNPLVLVKDVDYSEGPSARWYPKGESPILAELVKEGKLPPVAKRVGPEPIVVESIDGIGKYGGTWIGVVTDRRSAIEGNYTLWGYQTLVRFSPQGYPLVPHIAKSWEISPDNREFTFHLRKGIRWSDGHPFTADDILYFWKHEQCNKKLTPIPIPNMVVEGKVGNIEKIDDYTVKFSFSVPYGMLLESLAGPWGLAFTSTPAHYLRKYHPDFGDKELIEREMKTRQLSTPLILYWKVKGFDNPECPRLSPWVFHTYRANPPYVFVRNPYYFMVDTEGNQLPYLDRRFIKLAPENMYTIEAGTGKITMQEVGYRNYTYLMSQRKKAGFQLRHWYAGDRSSWFLAPNLNRRIDPARPETAKQHALLNDKRFRQALSLAINRQNIIKAEFDGITEPSQIAPGPKSYFYDPILYKSNTEYNPDRANRLLDELRLVKRDHEGFRTFPDGSRMTFFLPVAYSATSLMGITQFVKDDFEKVGLRMLIREKAGALLLTEMFARKYSLFVAGVSQVEFLPHLEPRLFVPLNMASVFGLGYAKWNMKGGLYGDPSAKEVGCIEIPGDHPLYKAAMIYNDVLKSSDRAQQKRLFSEIQKIAADNIWTINICTPPPVLYVVKDGLRNVPETAVRTWMFMSPGNTGIETFFFEEPYDSPGAIAQIKKEVIEITPNKEAVSAVIARAGVKDTLGRFIRYILIGIVIAAILLVGFKHPYVGRRLLMMIPMLIVISVVTFTVIQLPPGDYASSLIMQLKESGSESELQRIEHIREQFHLDKPMIVRYAKWMGLYWFRSFNEKDTGLLQGNLGRSMETNQLVTELVGERLLLTFLISLGTILFTWAMAIPIGIYSAVRQYSVIDYILTFIGFVGMCIPGFLLALLLIYFSGKFFGIDVSGLFSAEFASQPEWTWAKVNDLLQHIWVPVVVLSVGGTAGMIRVMRGNLLDELRKPYVVTAMAKGVRPLKLLFKYPVRLALNPFISSIGGIFPMLVSGGAIVAMVLSLPTVGPLMLSALMTEDMYLAGSMLLVLSMLGILGTLVSDLMLLWLDPRIRYES